MFLYVTTDKIGSETGGGAVTHNELEALKKLGRVEVINPPTTDNPFDADDWAVEQYRKMEKFELAHFYAGTYSKLIRLLKEDGCKVTYTCAAHDIDLSKEAFEELGHPYNFPHLINPSLFEEYVWGYRNADIVISPSTQSMNVLQKQGCKNIVIIPHGHYPAKKVKDFPNTFTVGYLGSPGFDKHLINLIKAWGILNYKNAMLLIAGPGTENLLPIVRQYGNGGIHLMGFVDHSSILYNSCSVYCQSSLTEGFGIEVLEAMSHGRPVVCSDGAGAADCVKPDTGKVVPKKNPKALANAIDFYKNNPEKIKEHGDNGRESSKHWTWDIVRRMYEKFWNSLI